MDTVTLEEYIARAKSQGMPMLHTCVRCPMCDTIQSPQDMIDAGAGNCLDEVEKYFAFSCVGRWTHQNPPPKKKGVQIGCDWTLGGLFSLHKLEVVTPDGKRHMRFEVCTREEAEEHRRGGIAV